jgi:gamma-glutamylcysteine synthetase
LTGIIPEEVRPRDLISFQAKGVSENVQKMRFVDYTETRMELQERLTDVRDECIARRPASRSSKEGGTHPNNQGDPASKTASGAQAMVEREKKQLKIMRDRQRKEVEQMLAYEMKQVELAESANRRLESDRKRFEQMELVKKERLMRQAKQKRFAELAKRATREVEEQYRKKQAQVIARRDKEAAELKVKQEQQRMKEAEERNDLRKQKVEDLRELAQAKHAVRETMLVDKRRNMERQEVERKRQMLQQQYVINLFFDSFVLRWLECADGTVRCRAPWFECTIPFFESDKQYIHPYTN